MKKQLAFNKGLWSTADAPLYCLCCMNFGTLILGKIVEYAANLYRILKPKCNKFNFLWDSTVYPSWAAYRTRKLRK